MFSSHILEMMNICVDKSLFELKVKYDVENYINTQSCDPCFI